ncbi:MAG: hypothetical protein KC591_15665, partial [Gemmatimonadetes bacterium]|nr:hypothetical protein [Gemmatimonadota bacterium]
QVKLRGFRIELGEIEAALTRAPGVREATVGVRGQGADARIVAWIAPEAGQAPDPVTIRQWLAERLPATHVPARVVVLERLPRSSTSKIDRRALPDPAPESATSALAPRDDQERLLATPWCETLGIDSLDVRDDFFEAGGNSLLAMRFVGAVRRLTGREVPVAALFRHPRFEEFVRHLHDADAGGRSLVRLRGGSGAPMILLPGLGGGLAELRPLAEHLDPARPVYAASLLDGDAPERIEDEARGLLSAIEAVVGPGPVHLLGWSYGALVAFELAGRRTAAGREVASLTLVDAPAPGRYDDVEGEFALEDLEDDDARRWSAVVRTRVKAARQYRPETWRGAALLIRGAESATADLRDDSLGWSAWVTGPLETACVPGTHESILSEEHVASLAALVERQLSLSPGSS